MASWRVGELASWRVGELASWRVGELASWRVGELARKEYIKPAISQAFLLLYLVTF
ncbi:hypothetical protein [Pseudoalteromonas prydzensis]|uniref:hypothetical protein n=1 Tax=Pseudoalteromonas prydzensis TaxID=182141 RepID=UPI0024BC8959|nr:hypothetical protein [Pseudoalteromonas prydzensis]